MQDKKERGEKNRKSFEQISVNSVTFSPRRSMTLTYAIYVKILQGFRRVWKVLPRQQYAIFISLILSLVIWLLFPDDLLLLSTVWSDMAVRKKTPWYDAHAE